MYTHRPSINSRSVRVAKNVKPIQNRVKELLAKKFQKVENLKKLNLENSIKKDPESHNPSFKPQICKLSEKIVKKANNTFK